MIESAQNARMQEAFEIAHAERAQAFANIFAWLFKSRSAPLNQTVLTEPSRCA
ncbi:hypothetical protein Q4578_08575 [Shimia thalassica]|jgi:hypothetical protein|uniref:hypothetical protein n=1 Tax=Shimia thalassica TaxID=1715693 RepID=UPI001C093B37|nr:hypothetical protein [Shimia thalassica]MBU2943650.1 hypothetical protein [Shimia thalassica]MDO6478536.1 hypothetical protein [Shimia thalassica]MDO6484729.1 hypothetical protein [Shimia thalassica]MDO6501721.1 hypothetical protein [Shimia thalassica]MDO6521639.1 hypothetical protein [Shimia thalassica]